MKIQNLIMTALLMMCFTIMSYGQGENGCENGKRNGIYYTDCWANATDDTVRLRNAIDAAYGKLIFNENEYLITDDLPLHSFMIIEGTGNSPNSSFNGSRIKQQTNGKSIFTIGETIREISIRDIALQGNGAGSGSYGIHAKGFYNQDGTTSSLYFQFSNLRFHDLGKGIYVDALDSMDEWQFDNVRLDASVFTQCQIAVHIDSKNSGWDISGIDLDVPAGAYGFYLESSTYTSMNHIIGNGTLSAPFAAALVYVEHHSNLSIRNAVSEGFIEDVIIQGGDRSFPIYLMNNHFMNGITVNNSTVVSTGNQFGFGTNVAKAIAKGNSQIYSIGDKFCFESVDCRIQVPNSNPPVYTDYSSYKLEDTAMMVYSSNQFKNTTSVQTEMSRNNYDGKPMLSLVSSVFAGDTQLRMGRGNFWFDIYRSEADATLTFKGNTSGYGYTFDNNNGSFTVKNGNLNFSSGTITLGSTTSGGLGSSPNGTLYYCSDCTATSACNSGGNGAIAKRINGAWVCN